MSFIEYNLQLLLQLHLRNARHKFDKLTTPSKSSPNQSMTCRSRVRSILFSAGFSWLSKTTVDPSDGFVGFRDLVDDDDDEKDDEEDDEEDVELVDEEVEEDDEDEEDEDEDESERWPSFLQLPSLCGFIGSSCCASSQLTLHLLKVLYVRNKTPSDISMGS